MAVLLGCAAMSPSEVASYGRRARWQSDGFMHTLQYVHSTLPLLSFGFRSLPRFLTMSSLESNGNVTRPSIDPSTFFPPMRQSQPLEVLSLSDLLKLEPKNTQFVIRSCLSLGQAVHGDICVHVPTDHQHGCGCTLQATETSRTARGSSTPVSDNTARRRQMSPRTSYTGDQYEPTRLHEA